MHALITKDIFDLVNQRWEFYSSAGAMQMRRDCNTPRRTSKRYTHFARLDMLARQTQKHRIQVRMVEITDQSFLLQSCWVVWVISPRITNAATLPKPPRYPGNGRSDFFRGWPRPLDREVKPIPQRFEWAPRPRCVAWYDFRRQPAQRTK